MQFSVSKALTLTKSNYLQWRTDMELRLTALGLWDLISIDPLPVIDPERRRKEALVLADIRNTVDSSLKDSIAGARNPKEAWDLLCTKFEHRSAATTNRLWNDFNIQQKDGESMRDYITRLHHIVLQLRTIGQVVDANRIVDRLVHGLSPAYDDLKRNLRTRRLDEEECEEILLQEETLHNAEKPITTVPSTTTPATSPPDRNIDSDASDTRRCRTCNRRGHIERDCYFVTCNICNKRGHLARDCWIGPRRDPYPDSRDYRGYRPSTPRTPYPPYGPDRRPPDKRPYSGYPDRYLPNYRSRMDPSVPGGPTPVTAGQQLAPYTAPPLATQHLAHYALDVPPRPLPYALDVPPRPQDLGGSAGDRPRDDDMRGPTSYSGFLEHRDSHPDYGFPIEPSHPPDFDQFCHMASDCDDAHAASIGDWLIDSGATNHYTSHYQLLHNFRPLQDIPILTGKEYVFARGIGDISIHLSVGAATVRNVL